MGIEKFAANMHTQCYSAKDRKSSKGPTFIGKNIQFKVAHSMMTIGQVHSSATCHSSQDMFFLDGSWVVHCVQPLAEVVLLFASFQGC